ncbi:MAG TPA: GlsB/YeaQ/YmgE family stress response membrane protein [Solirubrobacteraceae bacterium]|nr:GlsB/YeaQ/YmgE family stress response membrane protein [Solirubrobacteraceae bacterium]
MIGAIILGIVAGFLGRLLMPGKDPMGFFATTLLGLAGALIGFYLFAAIGIGDSDKFDLGGIIGAVIGVMVLLGIYRAVAKPGEKHHGRAARA